MAIFDLYLSIFALFSILRMCILPRMDDASPLGSQFDSIQHPKKRAYLLALAQTGVCLRACRDAGVHRTSVWLWCQDDGTFAAFEQHAKKLGAETLVQEAYRRAVEGIDKPVYYEGKRVDTIKEYSDTLLIFLLKGALPDIYRERYEVSGDRTRPLTVQIVQEAD
jgi:hypothetical protein